MVTRGEIVESSHLGALAVVDNRGALLAAAGNPKYVTYLRSSAKPFQALPTVASGALDHYDLDQEALAIMCASHHGTETHVAAVQDILDAIGLNQSFLRCGTHWPIDQEAHRRLAAAGQEADARHNNCSGKHAGMLTLARFWASQDLDYTGLDHPVQRAILARFSEMASYPMAAIITASDGCSLPTFAVPLANAALAFARLSAPDAPPECRRVVSAMQAYPHLVSNHGALDDQLMQAGKGAIVCKGGAEGYQGIAIKAGNDRSLGIALKVADGNPRALGAVIVSLLESLDLVDAGTMQRLQPLRNPPVKNHRGTTVGEIRAAMSVDRFDPPLPQEAWL
ncbi:MAG: asparaginase [Chloroflexota bacterium]|nr:asparaginase [Chloroflexota bacterium]